MIMRKVVSVLLILLASCYIEAQNTNFVQMPNFLFPSPLSQKMMKYGEQQPNLATGATNVTIPLYTIQVGDFSLPLFLNYYSNGIKVDDSPYPIGYGWTLQPAFRITRTVMGRPDGESYPLLIRETGTHHKYMHDFIYGKSSMVLSNDWTNDGRFDIPQEVDTRYDLFSVNLPHENFKFVIDKDDNGQWKAFTDGTAYLVDFTPDKITITDDNGIIYIFSVKENLSIEYSTKKITTTWGLEKITLPGKQGDIVFNWSKTILPSSSQSPTNQLILKDHFHCLSDGHAGVPRLYLETDYVQGSNTHSYKETIQLDAIHTPYGKIQLNYHEVFPYPFIKDIEISNNFSRKIKQIDFEYNDYNLKSLQFSDEGKFAFTYYSPVKFDGSKQTDYWGYYNNINDVTSVPKVTIQVQDEAYVSQPFRWMSFGGNDKSCSYNGMICNALEKITYPTGGTTEFAYETHKFDGREITSLSPAFKFTGGGGLRVSRIVNQASPASPEEIKVYKYGRNENGKGYPSLEPTPDTFIQEQAYYFDHFENTLGSDGPRLYIFTCRYLTVSSQSQLQEYLSYYPAVWYDEVTEYIGTDKTVFNYEFPELVYCQAISSIHTSVVTSHGDSHYPTFGKLYPRSIMLGISPTLKKKTIYKKTENTPYQISHEQYVNYYYEPAYTAEGIQVFQTALNGLVMNNGGSDGHFSILKDANGYRDCFYIANSPAVNFTGIYGYGFGDYQLTLGRNFMWREINISYDGGIENRRTTSYEYSGINNKALKMTVDDSRDGKVEERYYYPYNLNDKGRDSYEFFEDKIIYPQMEATESLITGNKIAVPLLIEKYHNTRLVGKKFIQYKDWGNNLVLPHIEYYTTIDDNGEPRITYHNYDSHGNPLYITQDDADKVVYLWSYNGKYPIAEIKNATYAEVKSAMGYTDAQINALASRNEPTAAEWTKIYNLRTNNNLSSAVVTVYEYIPLVGINKVTDPRGIVAIYHYDRSGKLLKIEDNEGNIIEQYDYHYQNQ